MTCSCKDFHEFMCPNQGLTPSFSATAEIQRLDEALAQERKRSARWKALARCLRASDAIHKEMMEALRADAADMRRRLLTIETIMEGWER